MIGSELASRLAALPLAHLQRELPHGHLHAIDGLGTRYHVHVCTTWTAHPRPYTPEIQFYDRCSVR